MVMGYLSKLLHYLRSPNAKNIRLGTLTLFVTYYLASFFRRRVASTISLSAVPYSQFLRDVQKNQIVRAVVDGTTVKYITKGGASSPTTVHVAQRLSLPPGILSQLQQAGTVVSAAAPSRSFLQLFVAVLPIMYIGAMVGVLYKFYHDSVGDVGSQSATKQLTGKQTGPSFDMVAGIDQAKQQVREVVELLKQPEKYTRMGAKVPKGILLVGPPGTGKTLLAKCVAAEAEVPFFYCSGSEFVEIFAGRGASRVRNLFKRARKNGPSIVFIDELDALGKARSSGFSSNEERDQTLNELLTAMDGFGAEEDQTVVVIGATNRYEVLDAALTRPGRFDRIIKVGLPNEQGRCEILNVHLKNTPCEMDIDVEAVGREAVGMSGAELAGLVNEAKIGAVREGSRGVGTRHLEVALRGFQVSRGRGGGGGGGGGGGQKLSGVEEFLERLGVVRNGRNFDA